MKASDPLKRDHGSPSAGDPYVPCSGNGGYAASHYDLDLDYRVANNRLSGTAVITATATQRLERFSLDIAGLNVTKVSVGGRAAKFSVNHKDAKLTVNPATAVESGAEFTATVRYNGSPGPRNSPWGDVGWEELSEGVIVAGQPTGAPTWFPCNDHPSDKATYRMAITAESPYAVIANGELLSSTARASRTTWVYETNEPMATYLATVQIGYYRKLSWPADASREQRTGRRNVPQRAWIPEDLTESFVEDFARQPEMIDTFERLFGPYPFAAYTVIVTDDDLEIPLEALGLSVFGRNQVDGHQGSNRLVAHELAHSWFGNSLTAASWKHIWLHEGFACYAEWLWSENSGGQDARSLAKKYWAKLQSQPQDFAIGDPGPDLMFDDRLYKRGALALHAVRLTIGDEAFFEMLREWSRRRRHGSVTTEEFIEHASGYSDAALDKLLAKWLFEEKLPALPRK